MSNADTMTVSKESRAETTNTEAQRELVAEHEVPQADAPKTSEQSDSSNTEPAAKAKPARRASPRPERVAGSHLERVEGSRPAAAKPNIYALITNTAKQKDAERAAKAADRQKVKEQQAATTSKTAESPRAKRPQAMPTMIRIPATPAPRPAPTLPVEVTKPAQPDDTEQPLAIAPTTAPEAIVPSEQPQPTVTALAETTEKATQPTATKSPIAAVTSIPTTLPVVEKPSTTTATIAESSDAREVRAAKPMVTPTSATKPHAPNLTAPQQSGASASAKSQSHATQALSKAPLSKLPIAAKGETAEAPLRLTRAELDRLLDEAAEGGDAAAHAAKKSMTMPPKAAPPAPMTKPAAGMPAQSARSAPPSAQARPPHTDHRTRGGAHGGGSRGGGAYRGRPSSAPIRYEPRGGVSGNRPAPNRDNRDRGIGARPVSPMPAKAGVPPTGARQGRDGRRDSPAPQGRPSRGTGFARGPEPLTPLGGTVAPTTPASSRGRKPADTKPAHSVRSPSTGTQDGRRGGGTHHRANIRPTKVVAKPAPLSVVVKPIIPLPSGPVMLPSVISVRELAPLLRTTTAEMIKKLMELKVFATINQSLNYDTASLIAEELGIETKAMAEEKPQQAGPSMVVRTTVAASDQDKLQPRPPVVTILGHVDHGKTSLLDAIRSANVAAGEAGGITQHIGAYQVEKQGRKITFLDTPGHAAFTAMRARGAQVTDVAVLVVAADDGVMPQTKEAIAHARAANVPIIVALNKIDRETAEPQRVMRQLSEAGVTVEEWGGDTPMVKVSARKLIGIDELLEMILLVADVGELKANPERSALGTVVEAEMDRSRGPVATMLVQQGTLRAGDYVVVNDIYGRVRAMFNERDQKLEEAGPSTPVVVLGLPSVPRAGDTFKVAADERAARAEAQAVSDTQAQTTGRAAKALSLDDLYAQMQAGKIKELNVVLKADVQGSLEPIRNSLEKLSGEELRVRILHEATGAISESDVSLALASGAIVIGFHVEPDPAAERLARNEGVDIRTYSIIYNLIEDVEKALKGLLEPKFKEVITGHAEVRALLKVSKRNVAGCYITNGKATRSGQARVLRAGKSAYDGRVASLKRFTEDVREVLTNFECGIMLENFEDVKQGDVIEFYHKEKEE